MSIPYHYEIEENPANDEISRRILSFLELRDGWHYGEGRGATRLAVDLAIRIRDLLAPFNLDGIEVFPDVSGGILVSGYYYNGVFEIFCDADGELEVEHRIEQDTIFESTDMQFEDLTEYLRRELWESMRLSDFFIPNITAIRSDDLKVWYSSAHLPLEHYQSSTPSVQERLAEPSANTFVCITTRRFPAIPSFFGDSRGQNFQSKRSRSVSRQRKATIAT